MQTTINNPAIAQGFQALQQAFFPDPSRQIEADLARRKGINIDADTRYRDASTGLVGEQTRGFRIKNDGTVGLADIFTNGGDLSDPVVRGHIAGQAIRGGVDPATVTGHSVYTNPQFTNPNDLATIMTGTGAVSSYGATQPGQAAALDNNIAVQEAQNAGRLAELEWYKANPGVVTARGGTGTPMDVSPGDVGKLQEMTLTALEGVLSAQGKSLQNVDPSYTTAVLDRATQLYQVTRNSQAAITQAIGEVPFETQSNDISWWPFSDGGGVDITGPAAQPAAPQAGQPAVQEGQRVRNPKTGQILVNRGGQWVADNAGPGTATGIAP